MDGANERGSSLVHPHILSDAWLKSDTIEHSRLDISTRCEKCQEGFDGPCYEHTDVKRIIFDNPPVPLAYSSLPAVLQLGSYVTAPIEELSVLAVCKIGAGTLFGPLIAPLIPLGEVQNECASYVLWSDETQKLQAYDLSDDFLCNWIKFIRPCSSTKEANVIAYQQRSSIYLVAVRDILPSAELRVYMKTHSTCAIPEYELPSPEIPLPPIYVEADGVCMSPESDVVVEVPVKVVGGRRKAAEKAIALIPKNQKRKAITKAHKKSPTIDSQDDRNRRMGVRETSGNDEQAAKEAAKAEVKRLKDKARYHKKYLKRRDAMTAEERELALAKNRAWSKTHSKYNVIRAKLKEGIALTPEEQAHYEKDNQRRKDYSKKLSQEKKGLRGTKTMLRIRQKLIEGAPLTPEEQLYHEKRTARIRAELAKKRTKDRIAKGLGPEPMKYHKPGGKPYKKAPLFAWQLAEQESSSTSCSQSVDASEELPTAHASSSKSMLK